MLGEDGSRRRLQLRRLLLPLPQHHRHGVDVLCDVHQRHFPALVAVQFWRLLYRGTWTASLPATNEPTRGLRSALRPERELLQLR